MPHEGLQASFIIIDDYLCMLVTLKDMMFDFMFMGLRNMLSIMNGGC